MMEDKGYEIKNAHGEGKYLAVKLPGMKRMIRLKTLGEEYSEERIRQRVLEESFSQCVSTEDVKPRIVYCRVRRYKRAKMSGLQKKYYVSTEGEPAIKAYELEQANAAKAKGKMFGASGKADVSVSDEIDTDKKKNSQAEFEASKKKMMRMLIICMIFIVLLVGVAVAYKLGYLAPLISYVTKK